MTSSTPSDAGPKPRKKAKPGALRHPGYINLAPSITTCARCTSRPMILAAVILGFSVKLDPLPLSADGLAQAVQARRKVYLARPHGSPMCDGITPGHHWLRGAPPHHRPLLLARHEHDTPPLPHDLELAGQWLPRFIPPPPYRGDDITEPPF